MIRTAGLSKLFNGKYANRSIDFNVSEGEVHAILGENGAGKTTLMRMLTGIYQPDEGEIFFKGEKLGDIDPIQAKELGIGMIHQHILLIDNFSVWQNVVVGNEKGTPFIKKAKMLSELEHLKNDFGLTVDLEIKVSEISAGQKQQVELLKLLYRDFDLLIFDEPTALLAPQEINGLYRVMEELKSSGKAIIFITHKLEEIFRISDRVSTLSKGLMLNTYNTKDITREELVDELFGMDEYSNDTSISGEYSEKSQEVLRISNLSIPGKLEIDNIILHAGEILGIAGVEGNGQKEFLELIFGAQSGTKEIFYRGRPLKNGLRSICSLIPEDRISEAMLGDKTLWENFILNSGNMIKCSRAGIIDRSKAMENSREVISKMSVKADSAEYRMEELSGGNQQKFILGRELHFPNDIIIAKNPTRGLDLKSERFVHEYIVKEACSGKAVLLLSTELRELTAVCHRIGVLYRGSIFRSFKAEEFSHEKIGKAMLGLQEENDG